jgi:PAS domain S-box-containing protein
MLETELFSLFEHTADAMYAVTETGEVCAWNTAAERLFGYTASEAMHRHIEEIFDAYDSLGTEPLAGGREAATRHWEGSSGGIPNFDLQVRIRSGERLWVNVSTIIFDNQRTKRRLFIRLARDITQRKHNEEVTGRLLDSARQLVSLNDDVSHHTPVEPLSEQERRILKLFADGMNPSSIARELNISPQTLRNHLHHINRKLRTHNRLEAVTHAQRRGLI